jgi:hypothetical protein
MKNNNVVTNMVQDFDAEEKRQGRENIDAAKTVQAFTSSGSLAASGDVQIIGDQIYVGSTSVGHLVDDLDKYYLATNPSGFITSADLNGYATQEWVEDYVSGFGPAGSNFSGFYNYTGGDYPLDRIDIYPRTNGQGYTYNEISVHGADTTTWIGSLLPDGGASPGKVLGFTSGGYEWVDQTGGMSAEMWDGQGNETQIDGLIFNQGPNEVYADTNKDGQPDVLLGNLVPTVSGASQGQVLGYLGNGELGWVNQQGGGTGGTPIYDKSNRTVQVSGMTFDHSTSNGLSSNEIFVNVNGSNVSMGLTVPIAGRASGKILGVTNGTGALGWINQPTIPVTSAFITAADLASSGYAPAEQSDWAEANSADLAYIKNKPVESWLLEGDNVYFTETSAGLMINASASGGLPAYTSANAGESLVVNGTGDGVTWTRRISGSMYNGGSSVELRRIRINTYNDANSPGTVIAFPASGQGAFCGTLMPEPSDGNTDQVARIIDNPNNPGIGMLAYQDDAAVISPLEKYTITTSTNPYEIDVQPGKWYEIVCSQSTAQTWHIYLEANSLVTTNTVHTIVRITRSDSSVSCAPELVWHDERGISHYERCDLTGSTSYYDFDCLVRKNGYTAGGQPWSFARVRRL